MPDDLIRREDALQAVRDSTTGSDALARLSAIPGVSTNRNAKVDGSPVAAVPAHERPAPRTLEEAKDVLDEPDAAHAAAAIEHDSGRVHHNHVTRDVKPFGQCPACDETWRADPDFVTP